MSQLVFVVPIRHPENVNDPEEQWHSLADLFSSFAAQTNENFKVNIVCNSEQILPKLPSFVDRIDVSLSPNISIYSAQSRQAAFECIRTDKGKRVHAGLADVVPDRDIVMVCDDDDLIHRRLVEVVLSGRTNVVRFIENGYKWFSGTTKLLEVRKFHRTCGTSLAIPARFYKIFDPSSDLDEAISELGSHILPFNNMINAGWPAEPIDFCAAVYRVNGSNSTQVEVARAARYEHSFLSRLVRKTLAQATRHGIGTRGSNKKPSQVGTLSAGEWFQRDFLGGRAIGRG